MTTETNELHAAIYTTQTLLKQAADVIELNMKSLAESHTRNGIIEDTEVQASIESDADLIAELRAAALPWDQRHKKPEPTDSMGMPVSCGKPLCAPGDHHPLCKLAAPPAAAMPAGQLDALLLEAQVAPGATGYSLGAMQCAYKRGYADGAAQPAPTVQEPVADNLRAVEGLLLKFQSAVSNMARTHQEYMGKAMGDETYARFAKARDETIPALRAELLKLYTTPPAASTHDLSRLEPFVQGLGKAILRELMDTKPAAPVQPVDSKAKGAIMGAAYDFRDAHISGSLNLKRSAHDALENAVDAALKATAAQPTMPYGWVRMNPGFNSGVFHLGTDCPPGWVGGAVPVSKIAAPEKGGTT